MSQLGEGPLWDEREGSIIWVDVPAGLIRSLHLESGRVAQVDVGQPVGCVVARARGGYVVGMRGGLAELNAIGDGATFSVIAPIEPDVRTMRLNDGKCDPHGRFWVGSLSTAVESGRGTLYCLHPDGELSAVLGGLTISNGLAWSADASTMYFIDTLTNKVDAFDFARSGMLSRRRAAVTIPVDQGLPDGMCIDAEDCLWVALFGGSAVHRYSPTGELLAIVEVATPNVTSCAFGGPGLSQLYITTATWGGPESDRARDEHAGMLFVVAPGVVGAAVGTYSG